MIQGATISRPVASRHGIFFWLLYGQNPQIELYAMGGVTKWTWDTELRWYQRVIISLAGPGIGLVIGGLLYLSEAWIPFRESYVLGAALLLGVFAYNNLQRLRGLPGVPLLR